MTEALTIHSRKALTDLQRAKLIDLAKADGLKRALEILEGYEGVQGAKIKIIAAKAAITGGQS